jgi:acetyl esterase/lipase
MQLLTPYMIWMTIILLLNSSTVDAKSSAPSTKSYGNNPAQKMDVYSPPVTNNSPIIVMVHGGAWRVGDKGESSVVKNKIAHWLPQGFIFISINYRLLPEADPFTQAMDVAQALFYIQLHAKEWGGDTNRMIVMGHSAGAHLVALLSASPTLLAQEKISPWRGSVILDSAAMDVSRMMKTHHYRLFDKAFGDDENYWLKTSPIAQLQKNAIPMLLVCSTRRDYSCLQAQDFSAQAKTLGVFTQVQPEDLSHGEINKDLGGQSDYTNAVDDFIKSKL